MNDLEKGLLDKQELLYDKQYVQRVEKGYIYLCLICFAAMLFELLVFNYLRLEKEALYNSNILLNEHIVKLNEELRIVYANCHNHKNL